MKPTYFIESWGTCSNYDEIYQAIIENLRLGHLEDEIKGAKAAKKRAKEMEKLIAARAGKNTRGIQTFSKITRQKTQHL